jgi:hypothetical protein
MKPESSFGSARARRAAKAEQDTHTAHALWVVRLQELVASKGCPPRAAFALLAVEVRQQVAAHPPQTRLQITLAWSAFERAVQKHAANS